MGAGSAIIKRAGPPAGGLKAGCDVDGIIVTDVGATLVARARDAYRGVRKRGSERSVRRCQVHTRLGAGGGQPGSPAAPAWRSKK